MKGVKYEKVGDRGTSRDRDRSRGQGRQIVCRNDEQLGRNVVGSMGGEQREQEAGKAERRQHR